MILERESNGELSVFAKDASLPPSTKPDPEAWFPEPLFKLIDPILAKRDPKSKTIIDGDGAAGDPASLGIALYVLDDSLKRANKQPQYDYRGIADQQYNHLVKDVPRSPKKAISQRETELQYW